MEKNGSELYQVIYFREGARMDSKEPVMGSISFIIFPRVSSSTRLKDSNFILGTSVQCFYSAGGCQIEWGFFSPRGSQLTPQIEDLDV